MIKRIAAIAVVFLAGCASAGAPEAKYELKRIPMGPRPDQYVLVPADRAPQTEQPFALTGERQERRGERAEAPRIPSHPKGTHGQF